MTFEEGVALLFHKLGDSKIMALGSSVNDYVMVRNVSCLFYDGKIYFKTDKNFRKTQQLYLVFMWNMVFCKMNCVNKMKYSLNGLSIKNHL